MGLILLESIIILCLAGAAFSPSGWSHMDQAAWPDGCKGPKQSPINIVTANVAKSELPPLHFHDGYKEPYNAIIINNGYTIDVILEERNWIPLISGGPLPGVFALAGFHIHWTSEHYVNNRFYPFELHMVHYNTKYLDIKEAMNEKDGLVVLAVFYNIRKQSKNAFANITSKIHLVAQYNDRIPVDLLDKTIIPFSFLPANTNSYYFYRGSLTTPPCSETVHWIVFSQTAGVTKTHMKTMTTDIYSNEFLLVEKNNRKIQHVNSRKIIFSAKHKSALG